MTPALSYTQNGILHMLDRNKRIKPRPERFQNCRDLFDLILTCEERVYDQVVEGKAADQVCPASLGCRSARHHLSGRPGQDVQSEVEAPPPPPWPPACTAHLRMEVGVGDRGLRLAVPPRAKPSVWTEHEVRVGRSLGHMKSMGGTKEPGWRQVPWFCDL